MSTSIPPRSCLYYLEPIGIGSAYVESLTSYIERLALAHHVTARSLLLAEIAPLAEQYSTSKSPRENFCISYLSKQRFNGIGVRVDSYINAIESLTLRQNLCFLTMQPWKQVIDIKGFLRANRAWCPICYEEWNVTKQPVYDPLIWFLKPLQTCPIHHQTLCYKCPRCNCSSNLITHYSAPGYCASCRAWLGTLSPTNTVKLEENELERQKKIIENINCLISAAPSLVSLPSRERIVEILSACAAHVQGNIAELTRVLKVPRDRVCTWITGESLPTINSLLEICYSLNVPLLDFLTSELTSIHLEELIQQPVNCTNEKKEVPKKILTLEQKLQMLEEAIHEFPPPSILTVAKRCGYVNETSLRKPLAALNLHKQVVARYTIYKKNQRLIEQQSALEGILNRNEYPPLSLEQAAKQIGITSRTLRTNFPDLSYTISKHYNMYREMLGIKRMIQSRRKVFLIVTEICQANLKPTNRRISSHLDAHAMMKRNEIIVAIKEARRRFGYVT